jgi:hypothetical protein
VTAQVSNLAAAVLRALPLLSTLGLAGLVVTVLVGFEEPDDTLLHLSSVAVVLPVLAAFVHLGLTRELTGDEKRAWLRELTGRRAVWAWSSYLTCADRREAAERLASQGGRA